MAEKEGSNWVREEDTEKKSLEVVNDREGMNALHGRAEVAFARRSFRCRRTRRM